MSHSDAYVEEMDFSVREQESDINPPNSSATSDHEISHPGDGKKQLETEMPLLMAMAEENSEKSLNEKNDVWESPQEVFDRDLCNCAELALEEAGWDKSDDEVPLRLWRALILKKARGLGTFEDLSEYIGDFSAEQIQQAGLKKAYSQSRYQKAMKTLKDSGKEELLEEAAYIAVHAVFRNHKKVPDAVEEKYDNLSYATDSSASNYPQEARQSGLYALIDELVDIVAEHLDLKRGDNTSKSNDSRTLVGALAYSAFINRSTENFEQSAQHLFDLSSVLSGSTLTEHIRDKELYLWEVEEMFDAINRTLFEYVLRSGVISEPVIVSYDRTDIEGLDMNDTDHDYRTDDERWRFYGIAVTDPEFEFLFGIRLVSSRSERSSVLEDYLMDLRSIADIRFLFADREFDGTNDFEVPRRILDDDEMWVFYAQDDSSQSGRKSDYNKLRRKINNGSGSTAVVENAGPDDLHPPIKMIGYLDTSGDEDTLELYYTNGPLPDDDDDRETLIEKIHFAYNNQRSKIEPMFGESKDPFYPSVDSDYPSVKAFYVNMATVLFNIYQIVDTVPAPNNGLEFNTNQKEVLTTIASLAFGGPSKPYALKHLQDES